MVTKAKPKHQVRHALAGTTLGALGFLTLTTQGASASQVTVKTGDTVWGIAQQHQLTTQSIEDANPLTVKKISSTVDLIQVGQTLTLPDGLDNVAGQQGVSANASVATAPTAQTVTTSVQQPAQAAAQSTAVASETAGQASTAPVSQSSQLASSGELQSAQATVQQKAAAALPASQPASQQTVSYQQPASAQAVTSSQPAAVVVDQGQTTTAVQSAATVTVPQSSQGQYSGQVTNSAQPVQSAQPAQSAANVTSDAGQVAQSSAATVQQPATTTPQNSAASSSSADLQSGSVVSLATKIANSNSVPYVWGGNSLSGMDCSGFVDYVYAHAENKQLPHYTVALESCVNQHSVSEAQAGDLLFWGNHGSTYHVAIYVGNNQYAAAAQPGTNVSIYTISPYFAPSFAGTVK